MQRHDNPWLALRLVAGITQREAERRMGWEKTGHLSLIEHGYYPTAAQEADLRRLYATILLTEPATETAQAAPAM